MVHLIQNNNKAEKICLPNGLKTLYDYLVILKRYQINRKKAGGTFIESGAANIKSYLSNFSAAEAHWQVKALELMKNDALINCQWAFLQNIGGKISQITVNNFLHSSLNKLKNPKKINDAFSMRSIHKLLEDLYYNWKYIKQNPINPFSSQDHLEQFITQLQDFENICIRLEFLDPKYFNQIKNYEEKEKLMIIRNRLLQKKQVMAKQIKSLFIPMFNIS